MHIKAIPRNTHLLQTESAKRMKIYNSQESYFKKVLNVKTFENWYKYFKQRIFLLPEKGSYYFMNWLQTTHILVLLTPILYQFLLKWFITNYTILNRARFGHKKIVRIEIYAQNTRAKNILIHKDSNSNFAYI